MDVIIIVVHLFLAVVPVYSNLIPVTLAQALHWTPQVTWAYATLGQWFALTHRLITAGIVGTVSAHVVYEVWSHMVQPAEAPLALGIAVVIGYVFAFIGLVRALIQENNLAPGTS